MTQHAPYQAHPGDCRVDTLISVHARMSAAPIRHRQSGLGQWLNQTFDIRGMRKGSNPSTSDRTAWTLVKDPNGIA
jgi:hypothetical protein